MESIPPNTPLGISLVATTGAVLNAAGSTANQYPAAYENVIGVIATTPTDHKKELGDGWIFGASQDYAAHYGAQYDVGAPGAQITAGLSGFNDPSCGLPLLVWVAGYILPQITSHNFTDS